MAIPFFVSATLAVPGPRLRWPEVRRSLLLMLGALKLGAALMGLGFFVSYLFEAPPTPPPAPPTFWDSAFSAFFHDPFVAIGTGVVAVPLAFFWMGIAGGAVGLVATVGLALNAFAVSVARGLSDVLVGAVVHSAMDFAGIVGVLLGILASLDLCVARWVLSLS